MSSRQAKPPCNSCSLSAAIERTGVRAYLKQMTDTVALSPSAAKRVAAIAAKQGDPSLKLRLSVEGGGCSGFQYKFGLDRDAAEDDIVVTTDGVSMLVDAVSLPFLEGAVVDFVDNLGGASFQVKNPNATSGCGCGTSFSV